jgi:hypothetical protein
LVISVVRELLSVASTDGLFCREVVVVVVVLGVVVVVVQPTSAITQTPKTSGISFFIGPVLPECSFPLHPFSEPNS